MRAVVMATGLMLAVCPLASAQTVVLDLSATGNFAQTLDPGEVTVVIDNRLPTVRYDVTVRREVIPIAAFGAEGIGPLGLSGKSTERTDDPCTPLAAATVALGEATTEAEVPARRAVLQGLLESKECTRVDIVLPAKTAEAGTRRTLNPIRLRRGERLIVTISRPAPEGQTVTWTLTLATEPRGEWLTMYGGSLFMDLDDQFKVKQVEGGFRVVEDDPGWGFKVPTPSVYFTWLSSKQRHRDWSWGPSVGLGVEGTSPALFGGIGINYNQNISFVLGAAVVSQQRLRGAYRDDPNLAENLDEDQLYDSTFRPSPLFAIAFRFDRNPFKKEEPAAVTAPAPAAPAPATPKPAAPATAPVNPGPAAPASPGAPESSREADIKLRFDAKGSPRDPAALAGLVARAATASDVFIISHGWWNDESAADCFYRRMVGGIAGSKPQYLTDGHFRPLFVTVYWPSALFPMEPSDCGSDRRTESSQPEVSAFTADGVRTWAAAAFPGAVGQADFTTKSARLATLLERERVASLSDAEGEEMAGILVAWRAATDLPSAAPEGPESSAFAGTGKQNADQWRDRPDLRAEFTLPGLGVAKKWLNYGNAFTFWTMKERAGTVGAKGLYEVVRALQPLRSRATEPVRIHLIGHSFGGKLVTASLVGSGSAPNRANSLILLQGAFSQFAFASRDEIRATGVTVDRGGLYRDVLATDLVSAPIVVTWSSADVPNRLLYPAGVGIVNDVTESSRTPRFGSLGANGIRGARSSPMNLALQTLANLEAQAPRAISVDASSVILGHSDLVKAQVFKLIWDTVEQSR